MVGRVGFKLVAHVRNIFHALDFKEGKVKVGDQGVGTFRKGGDQGIYAQNFLYHYVFSDNKTRFCSRKGLFPSGIFSSIMSFGI